MNEWLQFTLLSLAAYRITRFVTTDDWPPVLWLRDKIKARWTQPRIIEPEWRQEDIDRGIGKPAPYEMEHNGLAWYEGLECPWCVGTIISFALVFSVSRYWSVPLVGLQALAVATVVGLIGGKLDG